MDDRNDRRRDRSLSWREIDQLRDKSKKRERDPMQKASSPAALNAQKSYRAALERAFAAGTLGELAKTLSRTGGEDAQPAKGAPDGGRGAGVGAAPAPPASGSGPAAASAAGGVAISAPAATEDVVAGSSLPPAPAAAPRDPDRSERQKLIVRIRDAEGREPV